MTNNLSIIITLFKTPLNRLKILKQYKNYPILIFDQETKNNSEQISKIVDTKFEYFHSNNNLGLCKSTNFLVSKVKTKYFLFTQADIKIDENSIENLIKGMNTKENIIFAGPVFNQLKSTNEIKQLEQNYKLKSELDASVMLCDLEKVKQIGFFDEDFFLYWEDKDLMERVNKSNFNPGQVVDISKEKLFIQTGNGLISITRLQLEGKKSLDIKSFLNGYTLNIGDYFGK